MSSAVWRRGGKWWLSTECGRFAIAKCMCRGEARYMAYDGKEIVGAYDGVDAAKDSCADRAACEDG